MRDYLFDTTFIDYMEVFIVFFASSFSASVRSSRLILVPLSVPLVLIYNHLHNLLVPQSIPNVLICK